ncbi:MAG: response regulator [Spirochaetes bacterium]|nr:response regulator [Spirochaetota bacterium]
MMKILLIDDEESIVNILTISLKSDGYEIISSYNGRDGVEKYKKESPDIVITDLKMPGVSGLEVLKRIKEINPDAEVIIITGHGDMDSAIEALEYGASDFINKPIKDSALAIALSRAKEKISIKKKLREYTRSLENQVEAATQEIRRKSNFQTKLISSSNNGIVATDENGKIVIYNPGAESIFGYERLRVIDKMKYNELYPLDITLILKEGLDSKKIIRNIPWAETQIISKSGEKVPVLYSGSILYEKGIVMGNVVFFQDRREIKRLEDELIRSERLAAIGQTVAGLAHYIKNILTGLKGGSYIVNAGIKNNSTKKIDEGWEMVQKNITRVSDLVRLLIL